MRIKRLITPVRQKVAKMVDTTIKPYAERYGCELSDTEVLSGLSYLLMRQPYNPVLWNLYSTCRYLHSYKPKSIGCREIRICDYYVEKKHWLTGSFSDIRDIIAIDNTVLHEVDEQVVDEKTKVTSIVTRRKVTNPTTALATLYAPDIQDLTLVDSLVDNKSMYVIPVQWIPYIAVRDYQFVLMPFAFCCREVLLHSATQMIRCQSLVLEQNYLVDKTYFHVGCGPCRENTSDILVQIFAALSLHVSADDSTPHLFECC